MDGPCTVATIKPKCTVQNCRNFQTRRKIRSIFWSRSRFSFWFNSKTLRQTKTPEFWSRSFGLIPIPAKLLRNSNRNWNSQLHNFLRSIQRRFGFQIDPAGFVDIRKNIHFRKLKAIQFFRSNDERDAVAAQFRSNWLFGIENCNFQAKIASRPGRGLHGLQKLNFTIYNYNLQFPKSQFERN